MSLEQIDRMHAVIQELEALDCWYLAQKLRALLQEIIKDDLQDAEGEDDENGQTNSKLSTDLRAH